MLIVMEYARYGKLLRILRQSRDSHYYGRAALDHASSMMTATVNDVSQVSRSGGGGAFGTAAIASAPTLSSHDLTSFAYQIANGMKYLASKGVRAR